MSKQIEHQEKTVVGVAVFFTITDDKTWDSITEEEKAIYRLKAWELLDLLYILGLRQI